MRLFSALSPEKKSLMIVALKKKKSIFNYLENLV